MSLDDLRRCTHFLLVYSFGRRAVVDEVTYRSMGDAALAGVIALPMTRREAIRRRVAARRSPT